MDTITAGVKRLWSNTPKPGYAPNVTWGGYAETDETVTARIKLEADTAKLAMEFSRLLRATVRPTDMREVVRRNAAQQDPNICHSHDFVDANEVMAQAFGVCFGREPRITANEQDADVALFNAAWSLAKQTRFYKNGKG